MNTSNEQLAPFALIPYQSASPFSLHAPVTIERKVPLTQVTSRHHLAIQLAITKGYKVQARTMPGIVG